MGILLCEKKGKWLNSNTVGVLSGILWSVLILFYSKNIYIYTIGITILGKENVLNQFFIDFYRYLIGSVGSITIIWSLKKIYTVAAEKFNFSLINSVRGLLEYMGRNSIIYYILSTYLLAWILPEFMRDFTFNFFFIILETIIVAGFCNIIGNLIKQLQFCSKWLLAS